MSEAKDFTKKSGVCVGCKRPSVAVLYLVICENGSHKYTWACPSCERKGCFGNPIFIPNEKVESNLTKEQLGALPVTLPKQYERCVVCGCRAIELHHWSPKGIFGQDEAERWPKDYLCPKHHAQWHNKVTPDLVKEGFTD